MTIPSFVVLRMRPWVLVMASTRGLRWPSTWFSAREERHDTVLMVLRIAVFVEDPGRTL